MLLTRRRKIAAAVALCLTALGVSSAAVAAERATDLGAKPVFVVRSDNTVDASVAGAAAARASAPLLYTSPGSLDTATRDYLTQYAPSTVVMVGGTAALSETVEASVKALGYKPVRVTGADRSETAVKLGDLVSTLPATRGQKGDTGAQGATGATGATGPGALRVKDANGLTLGTLTWAHPSGGAISYLSPRGYLISTSASGGPGDSQVLSYVSGDCSGTPILPSDQARFHKSVWRNPPSASYFTNEAASGQTGLSTNSQWLFGARRPISPSTIDGFALNPVTASAVGVHATITGPLSLSTQ